MSDSGREEGSCVTVRCRVFPETFLSPATCWGLDLLQAPPMGAQGSFPVSEGRSSQFRFCSGSPKVRLRKAGFSARALRSFACNLVRVVCQALGQTFDLCDFRSHHICQADVVIPILLVSSLSYIQYLPKAIQ